MHVIISFSTSFELAYDHASPPFFLQVRTQGFIRHALSSPLLLSTSPIAVYCSMFFSSVEPCSGFCIAKTAQALMVGIYDDKIQAGNCNTVHLLLNAILP
jgi:hypothetical protein